MRPQDAPRRGLAVSLGVPGAQLQRSAGGHRGGALVVWRQTPEEPLGDQLGSECHPQDQTMRYAGFSCWLWVPGPGDLWTPVLARGNPRKPNITHVESPLWEQRAEPKIGFSPPPRELLAETRRCTRPPPGLVEVNPGRAPDPPAFPRPGRPRGGRGHRSNTSTACAGAPTASDHGEHGRGSRMPGGHSQGAADTLFRPDRVTHSLILAGRVRWRTGKFRCFRAAGGRPPHSRGAPGQLRGGVTCSRRESQPGPGPNKLDACVPGQGRDSPTPSQPPVLSFCVSAAASEIAGGTRGSHSRQPEKVLGQKEQGEGAWQSRLRCLSPGECADQGQTPAPLP